MASIGFNVPDDVKAAFDTAFTMQDSRAASSPS